MNDKQAPGGNAFIFLQHTRTLGQASGYIGRQGHVQGVQASFLLKRIGLVDPSQVGELRVVRKPSATSLACQNPQHVL